MLDPDAFEWRDDVREPELPDNPFVVDATGEAGVGPASAPADARGEGAGWDVPSRAPVADAASSADWAPPAAPLVPVADPVDDGAADDAWDEPPFVIDPETGRRTVTITGRPEAARRTPAPRQAARRDAHRGSAAVPAPPRRRSGSASRRPSPIGGTTARVAQRPDRIALWAVVMALVLVLAAATTSRAAAPEPAGPASALSAPAAR